MDCMEKINLQHLYIPNQKMIHLLRNIRHHGKRQFATFVSIPTRNWYIYWNENVSYCTPQGISLCTEKFSLLSWYYLGIFFINFCILINIFSTQLILSHAYTTHTSLWVPLSSLNFCLSNLDFGYLNNLAYLNEWWKPVPEIKGQAKNVIKNLN